MKRIMAFCLSMMLILSLGGCAKVTKTVMKRGDTNTSSGSSSSSSSSSSQQDTNSGETDSSQQNSSSATSSTVTTEEADNTVNEVLKNAAVFNGATADESGYALYYVDSASGDDDNDGRTQKTAWKTLEHVNKTIFEPGTKVLLKRGSVFDEQLIPISSGTEGKNFVVDAYGTGAKPVINGGGESMTVLISRLQYVEVRNLEITNISQFVSNRKGVSVVAGGQISNGVYDEGGFFRHIYLINLDVRDVSCNDGSRFYGGIVFYSYLSQNPTAFADVLVQGCTVSNTGGAGIVMASDYENGPGVEWSPYPYFPSQNVCVRGNYVSHCASDGIFLSASNNLLIEYNTVVDTSYAQGAYAGIWPHYATNVVMQYNEAYDTKLVGGDGQGFDVDINCVNTVVQYNYSHDNEGGFILLCTDGSHGGYNKDITVRYNISQNDSGQIFTLSGPISDVKIYNNTVYTKSGLKTNLVGAYDWGTGQSPADARFTNNLFYLDGTGGNSLIIPSRLVFDNNLFWGSYNFDELSRKGATVINTIKADPLFESAGTASKGIANVTGYRLKVNSPCIDAGAWISQCGGRDYFGTSVTKSGKPDIGAIEHIK